MKRRVCLLVHHTRRALAEGEYGIDVSHTLVGIFAWMPTAQKMKAFCERMYVERCATERIPDKETWEIICIEPEKCFPNGKQPILGEAQYLE